MAKSLLFNVRKFRVIDGDSVEVEMDLGCKLYQTKTVRLAGVDAPEMHGATKGFGEKVRGLVDRWLSHRVPLTLMSLDWDEKYGRLMGDFYSVCEPGFPSLTGYLLQNGLALPYDGGQKRIWAATELAKISSFVAL